MLKTNDKNVSKDSISIYDQIHPFVRSLFETVVTIRWKNATFVCHILLAFKRADSNENDLIV